MLAEDINDIRNIGKLLTINYACFNVVTSSRKDDIQGVKHQTLTTYVIDNNE